MDNRARWFAGKRESLARERRIAMADLKRDGLAPHQRILLEARLDALDIKMQRLAALED